MTREQMGKHRYRSTTKKQQKIQESEEQHALVEARVAGH